MTHDVVVAEIMNRAKARNVLTHYCGRSQLCQGHRGMPDLLCVGLYHQAFIEVKIGRDQLDPEQTDWRHHLQAAGVIFYVLGADALTNGVAERILDFLATGKHSL
jgi:hypothetical protein